MALKKRFSIYLPPTLHDSVRRIAFANKEAISDVVERMVRAHLGLKGSHASDKGRAP